MKFNSISTRLLTLAVTASLLAACKKDDESPKGMTWTMDNKGYSAATTEAYSNTSGDLVIIGHQSKSSDYPEMVLIVPKRTGNSDQSNYNVSAFYTPDGNSLYEGTGGNVTVSKYSTSNVGGTFHLTMEDGSDVKMVTNGKFNIDY